ncbi:Na/Pi cotransporter family protein [Alicyclobacillus dauci]|uniref:Na/Pi symporter n=1 Tax=Alicyclobacillus dauci TaxID=1475485 RepID=A0ABY6Z7H1_9BACL|nr:Na/Pi symporter [Alicyclobacillus dauci]WAH38542.1 Na/Pi symporter [Alicyclobacillus dauci]
MWANAIAVVLSLVAFIGGLKVMRQGLEGLAEGRLAKWLQRLAQTPTRGILTGTVTTAVLQSSAAITAITVGLVAGRNLTFRNGLGIVLGSNVGSTLTPQILTLNLWSVVIPSLAVGILGFLTRKPTLRQPSQALVGFSCIFIALEALKVSLHPLTTSVWFRDALQLAGGHILIAILAGCAASALVQSSTATTIITMALASTHVIPTSGAIAIVLGANVGTCFTSVIAAIGESRQAQQVALAHVILNVFGVLAFVPVMGPFTSSMAHTSPDIAQQIANAHTVFNIVCTVLVWPFTRHFAHLIERLLPDELHA